jgi:hypothetical protein
MHKLLRQRRFRHARARSYDSCLSSERPPDHRRGCHVVRCRSNFVEKPSSHRTNDDETLQILRNIASEFRPFLPKLRKKFRRMISLSPFPKKRCQLIHRLIHRARFCRCTNCAHAVDNDFSLAQILRRFAMREIYFPSSSGTKVNGEKGKGSDTEPASQRAKAVQSNE